MFISWSVSHPGGDIGSEWLQFSIRAGQTLQCVICDIHEWLRKCLVMSTISWCWRWVQKEAPLSLVPRVICPMAALLTLRLERVCNWLAGMKLWFSKWWSWGHIWLLTASRAISVWSQKKKERELWKDVIAFSRIASPDLGLFQGQMPLTFSAILF